MILKAEVENKTGVDVSRPTATPAVYKEHGNTLIGITANNQIGTDKRQVDLHAVSANVIRPQAEHPEEAVFIKAGKDSRSGLLVQVVDQARMAGVADDSIAASLEYH